MRVSNKFLDAANNIQEHLRKFNPYHDKAGRFATSDGATSESYKDGRRYQIARGKEVNGEGRDVRDTRFIVYEGVEIHAPRDLDASKQSFTIEDMKGQIDSLPAPLKANLKEVHILDTDNPADAFWAAKYNIAGFSSFASGGDGITTFYRNRLPYNTPVKDNANREYLPEVFIHEAAHHWDFKGNIADRSNAFSNSPQWIKANTDIKNHRDYVTDYSRSSKDYAEDLAESVMLYVQDNKSFSKSYPQRFLLLDNEFHLADKSTRSKVESSMPAYLKEQAANREADLKRRGLW